MANFRRPSSFRPTALKLPTQLERAVFFYIVNRYILHERP